ncbi:NAD(P)/FAD-dependent oxidoreductase [bacterium]|nr:NAD(P)/FAD-dependent oxidoreductase [bacterium]
MIRKDYYDVIIVGAGPAGSTTAKFAAQNGAKVLLLEKDREIGVPVRCAEGVGAKGLLRIVGKVEPNWIASTITGFRLVSPDGTAVDARWGDCGYCLDRKVFDYELANIAAREGAEVVTKAYVNGLIKDDNGRVLGVKLKQMGNDVEVRAGITVGADGVETRVGRWAGLNTFTKMRDMESCAQFTIADLEVDQDMCEFVFSNQKVPGGYLWVFPKGNRTANVGIGISGEYAGKRSALSYLKDFVEERFSGKPILSTLCGGVPCSLTRKQISGDGFMLVGDAAHQVNPISGGGIVSGMYAGMVAGKVAAGAVRDNNFSAKRLEEYDKEWGRSIGKDHERFYRIKEAVFDFSDDQLNKLAQEVLKIPIPERSLMRIFKAALKTRPKLIFDVIKLFT